MRLHNIAACVVAALASAAVPQLAYSAPPKISTIGGPAQITHFKSVLYAAGGYACTPQGACAQFVAQVFDDLFGVLQGSVQAYFYDPSGNFSLVSCNGPEYAKSLFVNSGNGNTTVSATLDPAAPNCLAANASVPIVITLSGNFNGNQSDSRSGASTFVNFGVTFKQNFTSNSFSETFYGSIGSVQGPFDGSSLVNRETDRQQVK